MILNREIRFQLTRVLSSGFDNGIVSESIIEDYVNHYIQPNKVRIKFHIRECYGSKLIVILI